MRALFIVILAAAVSGCAGYKLGPTNGEVAGSHSVSVQPFRNDTMEPRLIEYVTLELRKQLQQDGTYRLETQGGGDIVLSGKLIKFNRSELAYQPNDILTPQDYAITLTAEITATDRSTGKVKLRRVVNGTTIIRVGTDLASSERQAAPLAAADLARNAVASLVDGSW
jgi:hypothetical protein